MSGPILFINNVSKTFLTVTALANFTCSIRKGEIVGLIGPNGAGKTTLFNIISGFEIPDEGNIRFKGGNIVGCPPHQLAASGIGRTFQNLRLVRQISVLDNVLLSFRGQLGERLSSIFLKWRKCLEGEAANCIEAMELLHRVGLDDKAAARAGELSYGQQKLLSIACALAGKGDVLLLDEPVAGIALGLMDRIITEVHRFARAGSSVFVIEHNLEAVTALCDRAIFMAAGTKVSEGTPEEVRNDPKVIDSYLRASDAA